MEGKMGRHKHVCDWPGCAEKTGQWFTDGWTVCSDGDELLADLPDDCLLCPRHARAFEALELGEQPPTTSLN
jgi:hypothetical protein